MRLDVGNLNFSTFIGNCSGLKAWCFKMLNAPYYQP